MNITISKQILAGNLGDGWTDNNDAADALADFTRTTWTADLAEIRAEGHQVEIDIDVQHNAIGAGRARAIDAATFDMVERVEGLLTDENTLWDRFCASDQATEFFGDE